MKVNISLPLPRTSVDVSLKLLVLSTFSRRFIKIKHFVGKHILYVPLEMKKKTGKIEQKCYIL